MSSNRKQLLNSTIIAGLAIAALGAPTVVAAQDPAADLPTTTAADTDVEELVVTGSRIRRNEFSSPDPVQVISAETGRLKGVADAGALLRSASVVSGSAQITTTISSAFVTDGGPGAQTVSLRGLGANRTLVLLNGRRAGPAGTRGGVSSFDLNVLPTSIIDRIDILKDGASSIYGSDAVAGVVNIITKRDTDGVELETFWSQPEKADGEEYRATVTFGKTFDRGWINISGDWYKSRALRVGKRDYLNCGEQYRTSVATGERSDVIDPRTNKFQCRDLLYDQIWIYGYDADGNFGGRLGKLQYDYQGNLGQFIPFRPPNEVAGYDDYPGSPPGYYVVGYDDPSTAVADFNSPFNLKSTFTPKIERATVFAQGGFDLTPNVEAYGEVLLNRRVSKSDNYRQYWTYLYTEDGGDPFSAGFTNPNYFLSPTIATDRADSSQKVEYQRYLVGLRGDFPTTGFLDGWNWDLYGQYSRSEGKYGQDVILQDAMYSSDGRSDFGTVGLFNPNSIPRPTASCVGYTTPISNRPCVDVSWVTPDFLAGILTPAEEAFLFDYDVGKTIYTQTVVEGSISGDTFDLPAGPIGAAFGFQFRRDAINDTPGAVILSGNAWGTSSAGITKGHDITKEVFGELSIPLLKGHAIAESLDVSLSGRYTDVQSSGNDFTYKVGVNWQIIPMLRLRATQGTSYRAPALFELYLADQTGFPAQRSIDPCINIDQNLALGNIPQRVADNCRAEGFPGDYSGQGSSATSITGGGAGVLEPETSKAFTIGAIFTPSFADLNVAVDYFEIEVNDEVTQLGANNIVFRCYNSADFPNDPLCNLFDRNSARLITTVRDSFINIAQQKNRGIDLTVNYRRELPWNTTMVVDLQSTWQLEDKVALFEDSIADLNGFVGDPDWTGQFNVRFEKDDWTVFWGVDAVGKASDAETLDDISTNGLHKYKVHNEFTAYHSFAIQKEWDDLRVLFGVANVFDEHPPAVSRGVGVGNEGPLGTADGQIGRAILASQYDYIGRKAYLNISKKF